MDADKDTPDPLVKALHGLLAEKAIITFVRLPVLACVLRDHGIDDATILEMIEDMLEVGEAGGH